MKKLMVGILFFIAIAWFGHTFSKNFIVDPAFTSFLEKKGTLDLIQNTLWTVLLRIHIILALAALLAGPLAFLKSTRKRTKAFHRMIGKIYVLAVFLNFIPGLYVAFYATGGWISTVGFIILDTVWLITTYKAFSLAKNRKISEHKRWMIRSYAVTLANTSIYILTMIFTNGAGLEYEPGYRIAVWGSWVLNLMIAELLIRLLLKKRQSPAGSH